MQKKTKGIRGQVAIEYLATYGWALLLLVIVIGAIISTGVLTPTYLISEECNLGPSLPCNFIAYGDDTSTSVDMTVTNGFGYKILISKFAVTPEKADVSAEETIPEFNSGDQKKLTFDFPNVGGLSKNNIEKFKTEIIYVSCAPEINEKCEENEDLKHTLNGRITARVIETQ
ncbi:hypothetical protein HYT84_04445 [Candidatus Micrarchaeota archaeon]|nr:hypothetical protein [Candidatus Micrarchaeota archaeon]